MSFKIRREDPPATRRPGNRRAAEQIDKEVAHFQKNPGVWFKVREAASGGAYTVYSKRGCETRTKSVGDARYDIWARWPEAGDDE